jgi:hypothetical protein
LITDSNSRHRAAHLRDCLGRLIAETSTASRVLVQANVVRSGRRDAPEAAIAEAELACRGATVKSRDSGPELPKLIHFVPGHPVIVDFAYLWPRRQ